MGANIAGIYGAQIFRQDDRPRYRRAFSVNCAVLAFGLSLAIVRYVDDIRSRRRKNERRFSAIGPRSGYKEAGEEQQHNDKVAISPPLSDDQPGPILLGEDHKVTVSHGLKGIS